MLREVGRLAAAGATALVLACRPAGAESASYTPAQREAILALSPLGEPPADPTNRFADDPRAARFGRYLFFDSRFSANGKVSCASCHQPDRAFTDGRARAKGLAVGPRNTPTVLNAAYNHWFFWDGRVDSLWAQPLQVFENPKEMGSDRFHVARVVKDDPPLRAAYERIFGELPALSDRDGVTRVMANLGKAIEAYERKLVSRDSPFDRYVEALRSGDVQRRQALSPAARRGLALFIGKARCTLCHSGPMLSDGEFHDTGLPTRPGEAPDEGRAAGIRELRVNPLNGTGKFSDAPQGTAKDRLAFLPSPNSQLGKFKTPTLRNVARTAPYMHDGRFATLEEVVKFYSQGKAASAGEVVGTREATLDLIPHLSARQVSDLVAFLESLDGAPLAPELTRPPETP